jgi:photosystem II stability/assembly factor-like uncharacterized protein
MTTLISSEVYFSALHFINEDIGFLGDHRGTLFRTKDGGLTWEALLQAPTSPFPHLPSLFHILSVPTAETIFAGSTHFLFHSSDGGDTWEPVSRTNPRHLGLLGLNGENWVALDKSLENRQVIQEDGRFYIVLQALGFASPTKGYASAVGGAILVSANGGRSWKTVELEDTRTIQCFGFPRTGTCVAAGDGGSMHIIDLVSDRAQTLPSLTVVPIESVAFIDSGIGLAVGGAGAFLRTEDNGRTWQSVVLPSKYLLYRVSWFTQTDAIVVGSGGVILRSEDTGLSWRRMELPFDARLYCLSTPSATVGYVAGADGLLMKTRDGGRTFRILRFQGI